MKCRVTSRRKQQENLIYEFVLKESNRFKWISTAEERRKNWHKNNVNNMILSH